MAPQIPERRPAEDTRGRILEAALAVFAERGFAGATTRLIAGAAGVNIATLAYHFGDKQGLYDAVIDGIYERILATELPTRWPEDPRQRVRALVGALWSRSVAHRLDLRLLLRHVMDHETLPTRASERWTGAMQRRGFELLVTLDLPMPDKPALVLLTLNHLFARYAITDRAELIALTGEADPEEALAEHLADVACRLLGIG